MSLKVGALSVAYGNVEALHRVDLKIDAGTVAAVIGPNGAGKSTLLSALMGLLPARGSIIYGGVDISKESVEARVAAGLCLVPERRELFGKLRVEDNLLLGAFARSSHGMSNLRKDLEEIYQRFPRLAERRGQLAGTLSGGERQMLAVGRALMAKPRLLLLDEPSLGLAPRIVRNVFQIILELKRTGVSILLVEQNARAALQVADYGYVLETGEIVLEGAAADLSVDRRVTETYLGLSRQTKAVAH